jgi:hypothetical protein
MVINKNYVEMHGQQNIKVKDNVNTGGMEVQVHVFVTSAQGGCEWSDPRLWALPSWKEPRLYA